MTSLNTTTILGGSFRIGYRELAERRDWVYGIHSAYSVRTMDKDYYHAIAIGAEALSEGYDLRLTGVVPVGPSQRIGTMHYGVTLGGVELAVSRQIAEQISGRISAYYRDGDLGQHSAGTSLTGTIRLSEALSCELTASHDDLFDTRISGRLNYIFGKTHSDPMENAEPNFTGRLTTPSGLQPAVVQIKDPTKLSWYYCKAATYALDGWSFAAGCATSGEDAASAVGCATQVGLGACKVLVALDILDDYGTCRAIGFGTAAASCAAGDVGGCSRAASSVLLKALGC